MYEVVITLKSGRVLRGIINARSEAHARCIVRNADTGRDALRVEVSATW